MLVRIWETDFEPSLQDQLVTYANAVSLPILKSRPGCLGVLFFIAKNRMIAQTFWRDQASIDALETDPEYARIVEGILKLDVLGTQQTTSVFKLVGGTKTDFQDL